MPPLETIFCTVEAREGVSVAVKVVVIFFPRAVCSGKRSMANRFRAQGRLFFPSLPWRWRRGLRLAGGSLSRCVSYLASGWLFGHPPRSPLRSARAIARHPQGEALPPVKRRTNGRASPDCPVHRLRRRQGAFWHAGHPPLGRNVRRRRSRHRSRRRDVREKPLARAQQRNRSLCNRPTCLDNALPP